MQPDIDLTIGVWFFYCYFGIVYQTCLMKKIISLLSFVVISLISCSNSDDPVVNLNPNTLLLKKSVMSSSSLNGGTAVVTDWTYVGNKLAFTLDSNGLRKEYTYSGNLISKIDEIADGETRASFYAYDENNRLVAITGSRTETFEYNSDGTVTDKCYYANETLQWTATIYFLGSEISKIEKSYADGFHTTHEYTYDDKFTPTKNILGFDKIYLTMDYPYGRQKNVTLRSYIDSDGNDGQVNKALTYNAVGFPMTIHSVDDHFIDSYDAQFFYE